MPFLSSASTGVISPFDAGECQALLLRGPPWPSNYAVLRIP
jgi:hypothetical protein